MKDELNMLLEFTKECRDDMHEPDEQGIYAHVVGNNFDNAFGSTLSLDKIRKGNQELMIVLEKDGQYAHFNLATLVALARKARLKLPESIPAEIDNEFIIKKIGQLVDLYFENPSKFSEIKTILESVYQRGYDSGHADGFENSTKIKMDW